MRGKNDGHEVRCLLSVENWSRWTLGFPVVYNHYGGFQFNFHEREVFAAHRELVVAVNEARRETLCFILNGNGNFLQASKNLLLI